MKSITLWLFGGISELGGDVPGPSAEAWIAGVGPLTSLLLGGVFIGLAALAKASHPARASIAGVVYFALVYLGATNVLLAVFNVKGRRARLMVTFGPGESWRLRLLVNRRSHLITSGGDHVNGFGIPGQAVGVHGGPVAAGERGRRPYSRRP